MLYSIKNTLLLYLKSYKIKCTFYIKLMTLYFPYGFGCYNHHSIFCVTQSLCEFANARDAYLCCFSWATFVLFHADLYYAVSLKLDLIFRFKWTYKCKEKYNKNCTYDVITQ